MSIVSIISGTTTVTGEVPVRRQFSIPATGQAGQATFTVPYSSPLASALDPDGGDLLLVQHSTAGDWRGIVTGLEYSDSGVAVTAYQPWIALGRRIVARADTWLNIWPGAVIKAALDAGSVAGLAYIQGPIAGDTPLVSSYAWNYPDVWSVVTGMQDQSDGELHIDSGAGLMSWEGALAHATHYGTLLVAGQSFRDWRYGVDINDQVSEVIGTNGADAADSYRTARADVAAGSHWPAQAVVNGNNRFEMRELADTELARGGFPAITISGSITYDDAALRERDYVTMFFPRIGRTHTCRVLARDIDDASPLIGLTLQVIPEASVRIKAPGNGSKARGRGRGSVARRLARLERQH